MSAIDELLAAIESGKGAATGHLYSDDAVLDATVPGWRFHLRGGNAIANQYAEWFADPGEFVELDRRPIDGGEVVTYFLTWEEGGVAHGAHHSHTLELDATTGLIVRDRVFCGGRWPADRMAKMAEADET